MQTVILVIHIILGTALVGVVLMQRSEGGALGIGGGGGGGGGLLSGRGAAGALVRTTIIIGSLFILTSLGLTTISARTGERISIAEEQLGVDQTDSLTPEGNDSDGPFLSYGAIDLGEDDTSTEPADVGPDDQPLVGEPDVSEDTEITPESISETDVDPNNAG